SRAPVPTPPPAAGAADAVTEASAANAASAARAAGAPTAPLMTSASERAEAQPHVTALLPSGQSALLLAASMLALAILCTRVLGNDSLGAWLIRVAGISGAVGFGQRWARVRPDEPWLPKFILLGTLMKLAGSWFRYVTWS